jgi:hypothetical protein
MAEWVAIALASLNDQQVVGSIKDLHKKSAVSWLGNNVIDEP